MDNVIAMLCLLIGTHQATLEPHVQRLGSDKFSEREEAHQFIGEQLKVPWEELLVSWMRQDRKDAEISRRVLSLTEKWDSTVTDYGKYPWIDALPKDYPCRDKVINDYLERVGVVHSDEDYVKYRIATMMWLEDLKRQGWRIHAIWKIQEGMIPNEVFWVKNRKYP